MIQPFSFILVEEFFFFFNLTSYVSVRFAFHVITPDQAVVVMVCAAPVIKIKKNITTLNMHTQFHYECSLRMVTVNQSTYSTRLSLRNLWRLTEDYKSDRFCARKLLPTVPHSTWCSMLIRALLFPCAATFWSRSLSPYEPDPSILQDIAGLFIVSYDCVKKKKNSETKSSCTAPAYAKNVEPCNILDPRLSWFLAQFFGMLQRVTFLHPFIQNMASFKEQALEHSEVVKSVNGILACFDTHIFFF